MNIRFLLKACLILPGLDGSSFADALKYPDSARTKEAIFHGYPRFRARWGVIQNERLHA